MSGNDKTSFGAYEEDEGNDRVAGKGPCPKCGSKNNNVTYEDGHQHCFSPGCGHHTPPTAGGGKVRQSVRGNAGELQGKDGARGAGGGSASPKGASPQVGDKTLSPADFPQAFADLRDRGLKADTLRRYGYFTGRFNGEPAGIAPYYDNDGELACQKVRLKDKSFPILKASPSCPPLGKLQLFGRHVFGDRYDRRVVITEGELDAMSVAQATDFKFACVSVNTGAAGAEECLKANYLWLDRFAEIVLWLDDDKAGQEVLGACAKLFAVGKVRVVGKTGVKDASDLLQKNKPGDISTAIFSAVVWRPKGIVNASANASDVTAPKEKAVGLLYPPMMSKLQEMTGGLFMGDVIYHVAGTGVGKSTALREIQYHVIEQDTKIAVLSFEDTVRDMKFGIMSIAASERLHLVEVPDPEDVKAIKKYDDKMVRIHAQVFGGGLVELFDPETAEWSMEAILGYVRYCAKALDCKVIFIDPLSFVAAGIELTADERRVLDKVAGEFAKLAKELGIHIQISHHLKRTSGIPHEEGAPTSLNELRSSGGLANFAMCVIGWERNNQADGDSWRVTQSRIIKPSRRTGKSGLADVLYYQDNGRYVKSTIPFPPVGKPKGDGEEGGNRRSSFGAYSPSDTEY